MNPHSFTADVNLMSGKGGRGGLLLRYYVACMYIYKLLGLFVFVFRSHESFRWRFSIGFCPLSNFLNIFIFLPETNLSGYIFS